MTTEYNSIKDLFVATRQLRDLLTERGEVQDAQELEDTVTNFWATGGEAIGELKLSLLKVRPIVEHKLAPEALKLWHEIFDGATRLWDLSNHT